MITITETLYKKMPEDIKACFKQLPNPSSEEVRECFPETKSGAMNSIAKANQYNTYGKMYERQVTNEASSGNASRFFKSIIYQAKASKSERNKGCEELEEKEKDTKILPNRKCLICNQWENKGAGNRVDYCKCEEPNFEDKTIRKFTNNHPTVKPIALMEYLIKMVTREGQTVLDPFIGSGTTAVACKMLNRNYIGIELEAEYIPIIHARLNAVPERLL